MMIAERSTVAARSRWESIHLLRAIAALIVVVHHIPQFLASRVSFPIATFEAGAAGVDIFFVISGFVMYCATASRPETWHGFLAKRAIRVIPMYWLVTLAVTAAVWVAPSAFTHFRVSLDQLLRSLFFLPTYEQGYIRPVIAVGWTLHYEMMFYGLVAAGLSVRPRRASSIAAFALVAASLLGWLFSLPRPYSAWQMLYPITLEFALGVGLAHALHATSLLHWPRAWRLTIALAAVALGTALIACTEPYGLGWDRLGGWGAGAFGIVLGLALLEPELDQLPTLQRSYYDLGAASYALYLVHGSIFPIVWKLLPRAAQASAWLSWLLLLIGPVLASILVHYAIEARLTRALNRLRRGKKPSVSAAPAGVTIESYGE
jgi:exopolysaccharide production protein ExoZ